MYLIILSLTSTAQVVSISNTITTNHFLSSYFIIIEQYQITSARGNNVKICLTITCYAKSLKYEYLSTLKTTLYQTNQNLTKHTRNDPLPQHPVLNGLKFTFVMPSSWVVIGSWCCSHSRQSTGYELHRPILTVHCKPSSWGGRGHTVIVGVREVGKCQGGWVIVFWRSNKYSIKE